MKFDDNQPIYLQICDRICDKILRREWRQDERIHSVRELGSLFQVNPNTVMRAYERLQTQQIIYNQRGIGYFVSPDAVQIICTTQRAQFLDSELPRLFDRMSLLEIGIGEVAARFEAYQKKVNVGLNENENENR